MTRTLPTDSELLCQLDCPTASETGGNIILLEKEFGLPSLVPAYERLFAQIRRYGGRMLIMYRLVSYSRARPSVVSLAIDALKDRSRIVRYHACGALAYSLQKSAVTPLEVLLSHPDEETRSDAAAAIDAIKSKNHHYFMDRDHTGKWHWFPGKYSHGASKLSE